MLTVVKLADLSAADVSTEKFVRVAVRHGLYKCLSHDSAILDEKEEEMESYGGTIKAPKVLADIVESIMGAVYLDCGFDVNDVWCFGGGGMSSSSSSAGAPPNKDCKKQSVEQLVLVLCDPKLRENALLELFKKELFSYLGRLLWHSFGTIAALLQEIVSIYPGLSSPSLAPAQSNRVCNAIALLQVLREAKIDSPILYFRSGGAIPLIFMLMGARATVASHPDTIKSFLNAKIPLYLYPFLNTTSKLTPFEYLRLASLGVICALVKVDDTEVISFLISTEIIPKCLCAMEMGCEPSKTVGCDFHCAKNPSR